MEEPPRENENLGDRGNGNTDMFSKVRFHISTMNKYTPDMLVKNQWQKTNKVSLYHLIYRWVAACIFVLIVLSSFLGLGRTKKDFTYYTKWPIYLTHWGICICTLQALMAAYFVTRAYFRERDLNNITMNSGLRTYAVLHNIATIAAFFISFTYWLVVHDPAENPVDIINILVHGGNSVLMLIDLLNVSHPTRLIDFYWPLVFSIVYTIFTYLYFLAGGTNNHGYTYIYSILDWNQPFKTLNTNLKCNVFILVLHLVVSIFSSLRHKVAQKCIMKDQPQIDATPNEVI